MCNIISLVSQVYIHKTVQKLKKETPFLSISFSFKINQLKNMYSVVYQKVMKRRANKFISSNIDLFPTDFPSGWCSSTSGGFFTHPFFIACPRKCTLYCGSKYISFDAAICVIQAVRFISLMVKHYNVSWLIPRK